MPDMHKAPARDAASRTATCRTTSAIDVPDLGLLGMRSSAASPNRGYATIGLAAMGAQVRLTETTLSSRRVTFRVRRAS